MVFRRSLVLTEPATPTKLAERLSAGGTALTPRAVCSLLLLAANAVSVVGCVPLFAARIHHFFRGLQGASVLLQDPGPGIEVDQSDRLVREVVMQEEAVVDDGKALWPLWVCNACGMPAVMACCKADGSFEPAPPAATENLTLRTWMPASLLQEDSDGGDGDGQTDEQAGPTAPMGSLHELPNVQGDGSLKQCPCCGARAGQFDSVMRRFSTGEDAPTAVLAEELLRQLPETLPQLPAGGRKLLAFSDSRQRAAFFAPYLNRTIADASFIQPLLEAVGRAEGKGQPLSLTEWPEAAAALATKRPWVVFRQRNDDGGESYDVKASDQLHRADWRKLRDELAVAAYEHLTSPASRRKRMPALMVAAPQIDLSAGQAAAFEAALSPLLPDEAIRTGLVQRLLCLVLRRYAITFGPFNINRRHLISEGKGPTAAAVHRDPSIGKNSDLHVFRWDPFNAPRKSRKAAVSRSRQVEQVVKALRCIGHDPSDQAVHDVLEAMWGVMIASHAALMEDMGQGRYRLNAGNVLARQAGPWYRCNRCDARTRELMGGACEMYGCVGRLQVVVDPETERKQTRLVQRYSREPLPAKVLEHTAQLTFDQGRMYQEQFSSGHANVLSCSTTFEMGVDVGDLDTVFLRNVPRSTANYVQRVGRAGRRNQSLAHAVTFAQATPHDQHHYFNPAAIAAGQVPVPVVYTANPILAQRHVNAHLLGRFWSTLSDADGRLKVAGNTGGQGFFAIDPQDTTCPAARFAAWCQAHEAELATEVSSIVKPSELGTTATELVQTARLQLVGETATDRSDSVLHRGLLRRWEDFQAQANDLDRDAAAAAAEKNYGKAKAISNNAERARRMGNELCAEDLIGFLSGHHWLPNYAFPQDSVRLLVRQEGQSARLRLERPRAMGIIEYAPGAEVIVDGKLIRSTALDLEKREPVLESFKELGEGRVELYGPDITPPTPGTGIHRFIEPRGFSTTVDEPIERPNLFRKRPVSNSPVYLVGGAPAEEFHACPDLPGVDTAWQQRASLFTANYGSRGKGGRSQGHRICLRCGSRVEISARNGHQAAWGRPCQGSYESVVLAHRFQTAVLQVRFVMHPTPTVDADNRFWKTLSTALGIAASNLLDIERGDLRVDYRSLERATDGAELFIYDNIPGGAGYAQRVQQRLYDVLVATRRHLTDCDNPECRPDGSCYACLRTYDNQFHWPLLSREAPLAWLNTMLQ